MMLIGFLRHAPNDPVRYLRRGMDDIELGLNLPSLIIIISFVAAFASVMARGTPLISRDSFADRLKNVAARREELKARQQEQFQQRKRLMPGRHEGTMRAIIILVQNGRAAPGQGSAPQAAAGGWRHPSTPVRFIFARIAAPIVLLVGGYLYMSIAVPDKIGGASLPALPWWRRPSAISRRSVAEEHHSETPGCVYGRAFPDTLDLMVICVEAGMSIEAAFPESDRRNGWTRRRNLAEEVGITAAELAFLGDQTGGLRKPGGAYRSARFQITVDHIGSGREIRYAYRRWFAHDLRRKIVTSA